MWPFHPKNRVENCKKNVSHLHLKNGAENCKKVCHLHPNNSLEIEISKFIKWALKCNAETYVYESAVRGYLKKNRPLLPTMNADDPNVKWVDF